MTRFHPPTSPGVATGKILVAVALVVLGGLTAFLSAKTKTQETRIKALLAQTQELQTLREQAQELERLRRQEEQLQVLREENKELVKLRGEVAALRSLRDQAAKLESENKQLRASLQQVQKTARDTANVRDQNEKLQGALVEQQQRAQAMACINNLKAIQGAKEVWALEMKKTDADIPTDADLFGQDKVIREKPACPAGGVYTLGPISEKATCNIPGHAY